MSAQTISTDLRFAVWQTHGQKCSYCCQPISFGELDIDHVIPEAIGSDADAFEQIKSDLGLPSTFDYRSVENMLPAHRGCNRTKSKSLFDSKAAIFYLKSAADAAPKVVAFLSAARERNRREGALAYLAELLQNGEIMLNDLLPNPQPDTLRLSKALTFVDGEEWTVSPDKIESLLDRPVLIGGVPEMTVDFGDAVEVKMHVHTCREYRAACAAGYYARTNTDIKLEPFLKRVDAVLRAAEALKVPTLSYISKPFRGVADLDLLPVEIIPAISPDDTEEIKKLAGSTVGDLLRKSEIKILKSSSDEVSMEWRCVGLQLREICRADLDGDGIEDILCECYCWAVGGTLGYGFMSILSRKSENALFIALPA